MTFRKSLARGAFYLGITVLVTASATVAAVAQFFGPEKGVKLSANFAYGPNDRQKFDLYVPDELQKDAPLLVFFYGGGWSSGRKELYKHLGEHYAAKGYLVAIPDYRLSPEVTFPAFVQDGAKAVAAIRQAVHDQYGEHRLFLAGHSAGAQIAMLLTLDASYLKAEHLKTSIVSGMIGLSGPYDFLPLYEDKYKRIFPESTRAASQPINYARGDAPPLLLLTGLADDVVKPSNTFNLAEKIKAQGGQVEVKTYDEAGHIGTVLGLDEGWLLPAPATGKAMRAFIEARAPGFQAK